MRQIIPLLMDEFSSIGEVLPLGHLRSKLTLQFFTMASEFIGLASVDKEVEWLRNFMFEFPLL